MDRHSASLCCIELPPTRRSNPRDRMLDGRRVMENLLGSEDRVIPNPKYIEMVQQSRMTEGMRRQVVEWMLEVCEETRAEDILLPLAVNLLDRILSQQFIDRDHLQLTSAACLFVASKVVQAEPLEAKQLCIMSDNAFMPSFLTKMELIILDRLKWDLTTATPLNFLDLMYGLLPVTEDQIRIVKKHATALVTLTCFEYRFIIYPPSVIAAAAACAAIQGMNMQLSNGQNPVVVLQEVTRTDLEILQACQAQIEESLARHLSLMADGSGEADRLRGNNDNLPETDTPTEALESVF
ncbi:G1/S-specific cyclin-D2-like [Corticium candelabrum]|uniref:G1/S-specific cyclin-D2-like n=1 Tax=Corticium candelabrum TaxID=121492 RepID=UPI002E25593A|nr:G1/S-specific cyclin-D2-like [Corticium candelabrum]